MSLPPPRQPKQDRSRATRQRLLDATIDELADHGYASLRTAGVSRRAGVSLGAQQHHFPTKDVLVAAAIRHLAERQREELRDRVTAVSRGRKRVERALDVIFDQYRGRLFTVMADLSFAARSTPQLRKLLYAEEHTISREMQAWPAEIFEPSVLASKGFMDRWAIALSAMRGLAMLAILGHPDETVDRQWRRTRPELVKLLLRELVKVPANGRRSPS